MKKQPKPRKVSGGKSTQIKAESVSEVKKKHGTRKGTGDMAWQFHENPNKKPAMLVDINTNFFNHRSETNKRQAQMDKVWSAFQAVGKKKK